MNRRALRVAPTLVSLLVLAVWALVGGVLPSAGAEAAFAAPSVVFDQPTARGALGGPLTFSVDLSAPATPGPIELLREEPRNPVTLITTADVSNVGSGRYRATVTDPGHVVPNTTIRFRFRVVEAAAAARMPSSTQDVVPAVPTSTPPSPRTPVESPTATFTMTDDRFAWRTLLGQHVRLHWYDGDDAFAARALKVGDDAVARVAAVLGVTEDQPIDFFVYGSASGLDGALGPGTSEFVAGRAIPEIRTLFAQIDRNQIGSDWVGVVIPHELTHLVFDTATSNPLHEPPLWLNEGLAKYESEGYGGTDRGRVAAAVSKGTLIPLDALQGPFPPRQELFYLAYAEADAALDFLVRTYGQPKLVQLIRTYAAGVTDDEAFTSALGVDVAGFEMAWRASVGAGPSPTYGPRAPAAGSLPPGWTAGQAPGSPLPTTPAVIGGDAIGGGGILHGDSGVSVIDAIARGVGPYVVPFAFAALGSIIVIVALGIALVRRRKRRP